MALRLSGTPSPKWRLTPFRVQTGNCNGAVCTPYRLLPLGDAYHLAVASHYGMHFLLTWNCRHLANANKVRHLQLVNAELGLPAPIVTTPDLLLTENNDD